MPGVAKDGVLRVEDEGGGSGGSTADQGAAGADPWLVELTSAQLTTLTPAAAVTLTAGAPTFATVGTSEAEALAASAGRKRVELVNTSANFISISYGANAAVINRGYTLTPYGVKIIDVPSIAALAIRAVASDVSSNLGIQPFS